MKVCSKCKIEKEESDFYRDSRKITGYRTMCKLCCGVTQKIYRMGTIYGITVEGREEMLLSQNNKCKICNEIMTHPNIDHDHVTGKVRGILCSKCNRGLGLFNDNYKIIDRASRYLKFNVSE